MVPIPQDHMANGHDTLSDIDGESVVISGISGLYPESNNVKEFSEILYKKENPIGLHKPRWGDWSHPEVPEKYGLVPHLDRFDSQFFKVHYRLGNMMDAMARKILEQSYQAVYDAGLTAEHIFGKNVGVYTAAVNTDNEKANFYDQTTKTGFSLTGSSRTMFANRISYAMNAKGPSMAIDAACSGSVTALELAYLAIKRGEIEAAIVAGATICWHPNIFVHYGRIAPLCKDGKMKSFDQNADGWARSEAINVLFLQRAKDAKRIYAEVVHVKAEFGNSSDSDRLSIYRNPDGLTSFLETFYKEAEVSPQSVEFVEALGTAIPEVDKAELEAFERVFCKNRSQPLPVGSVASNIGHTEAASAIASITKVLLGYRNGQLAANINCETPRTDVEALRDGRMVIARDHQTFDRTYVAVNSLSFSGINGHVLLKGHFKPKDSTAYKAKLPRLVLLSGRQEPSVSHIIEDLESRPVDPEEIALLHHIYKYKINGHMARGYAILDTKDDKTVCLSKKFDFYGDVKRPVWFVYSGMGSQWAGMGTALMAIPTFAAAIQKCHKVLAPRGLDIVHILTTPDKTIYNNILHSFVGIAAVQIGLTDVLKELGIVPDNIIGHSVGELGCAYADGCFTAEEMILAAYGRGLVSVQTPFIKGSMAAVGIGYKKIVNMCPPEIEVACHNGPGSSTISGPAEKMTEFVSQLVSQGIFAKEVPCSNIAYHSRYIAEAGPKLLEFLSGVITDPKPRSENWLSTSLPMDRWTDSNAKLCSAWYHTNNLLSPVLFEETSRLIPSNAILIEVAPHGLLQAILKRSLPQTCVNIPLTNRGHPDNTQVFLDGIGRLYMEGYEVKIANLYPQIQFPVSTNTPMLSHLIKWIHDEKWKMPYYLPAIRKTSSICKSIVSLYDDHNSYLKGHVIRGKIVYPFSAALVSVWDTLAMTLGVPKKELSVQFRDIHLFSQPEMIEHRQSQITVTLHRGSGSFEVMDEYSKIVSGHIIAENFEMTPLSDNKSENLNLDTQGVYDLLQERDFGYAGEFQTIYKTNTTFTDAKLKWNNNWATFLDGIFQLNILGHEGDTLCHISHIAKLEIDVQGHKSSIVDVENAEVISAVRSKIQGNTRTGGVLLETVEFYDFPPLKPVGLSLKALKFVPRFQCNSNDLISTFKVYMQIISENIPKDTIKVVGINNKQYIFNGLKNLLEGIPGAKIQYKEIDYENINNDSKDIAEADVIVVKNLSSSENLCRELQRLVRQGTFIVNSEEYEGTRVLPSSLFNVLCSDSSDRTRLELGNWRPVQTKLTTSTLFVKKHSDLATLAATRNNLPTQQKLVVMTSYPPVPGLKSLIKKWRRESERNQVHLVMISGNENIDKLPELDLAFNVLAHDVWGGEYYVSCQDKVAAEREVTLQSARIGDLDSLQWVEMPEPGPGVKVTVRYAGINDLDVKRATGVASLKQDSTPGYGMDYSGTTDQGDLVMGVVRGGAASGRVVAVPELMWPVPAHWTLEDAATVPSAYAQAFYLLGIRAQLTSGMSVLIHGGTGALGQAAISVALAIGCEVFTTVGDVRKKVFLQRLFPELKADHIGNSRDHTFGDMVLQATDGVGCDVVISCVRGDLKNTTLSCAAFCGITFDTSLAQSEENFVYGMYAMTKQRSYVVVDFSSIFDYKDDMKTLHLMMSEGIIRGYVRPLSRVTYGPSDAARAFRLLSGSRHRGRVLLRLRDYVVAAQPRLTCSPDKTNVVVCDKDGFGLQLVKRLIQRGAKKIRIHSTPSTIVDLKVKNWKNEGIDVVVSSEDLSSRNGVVSLIIDSVRMGPIEGIFIVVSSVPDGAKIEELSSLVANLDVSSRDSCPSLRYFAVVSADDSIGQMSCLDRVRNRLPATLLYLPSLGKSITSSEGVSWNSALDATETALRCSQPLLRAHVNKGVQQSLLQQLAAVADIKIPEAVKDDDNLLTLGLDESKTKAVGVFLQNTYNITLNVEDIPLWSVEKIRELDGILTKTQFRESKGLDKFFSYVDSDELKATTELVFMPTLGTDSYRSDEIASGVDHMCIVPGLEGNHLRFQALAYRLKMPALVLQPRARVHEETPRQTAERFADILVNKVGLKNNFYLLGYETGVTTALELASILEDKGMTGTVICVGASPKNVKIAVQEALNISDEPTAEEIEKLSLAVVQHLSALISHGAVKLDEAELRQLKSWREQLRAAIASIKEYSTHTHGYTKLLIESAISRILNAIRYKPTPRALQSRIVLLRVAGIPNSDIKELQLYSKQPLVSCDLQTELALAASHPITATYINRYLDETIIEKFDKSNLCQSYVMNPGIFTVRRTIPDSEDF